MKVLVTGAAGFLGQGLIVPFQQHDYDLRLMDVREFDSSHEVVIGTVADLPTVQKAVEGVDAIVIAHMAPRSPNAYATTELSFDINVKGTAHLFFAAAEAGIKRVVVISSTGAILGHDPEVWSHELPPKSKGIYGLTKACQEVIAEQYARENEMQVAALRIGYILDADKNEDKYGRKISVLNPPHIDRRDIGEVARLCIECEDLGYYEVFHVMGTELSLDEWDTRHTRERLGWQPKFDFRWMRPAGQHWRPK